MAAVTIWADITSEDHAADCSLVAWMAYDRAEFLDAMSKLAVIAIWASADLLPLITQLSLEHALVVHLQFHRSLLFLDSTDVHPLLHHYTHLTQELLCMDVLISRY